MFVGAVFFGPLRYNHRGRITTGQKNGAAELRACKGGDVVTFAKASASPAGGHQMRHLREVQGSKRRRERKGGALERKTCGSTKTALKKAKGKWWSPA